MAGGNRGARTQAGEGWFTRLIRVVIWFLVLGMVVPPGMARGVSSPVRRDDLEEDNTPVHLRIDVVKKGALQNPQELALTDTTIRGWQEYGRSGVVDVKPEQEAETSSSLTLEAFPEAFNFTQDQVRQLLSLFIYKMKGEQKVPDTRFEVGVCEPLSLLCAELANVEMAELFAAVGKVFSDVAVLLAVEGGTAHAKTIMLAMRDFSSKHQALLLYLMEYASVNLKEYELFKKAMDTPSIKPMIFQLRNGSYWEMPRGTTPREASAQLQKQIKQPRKMLFWSSPQKLEEALLTLPAGVYAGFIATNTMNHWIAIRVGEPRNLKTVHIYDSNRDSSTALQAFRQRNDYSGVTGYAIAAQHAAATILSRWTVQFYDKSSVTIQAFQFAIVASDLGALKRLIREKPAMVVHDQEAVLMFQAVFAFRDKESRELKLSILNELLQAGAPIGDQVRVARTIKDAELIALLEQEARKRSQNSLASQALGRSAAQTPMANTIVRKPSQVNETTAAMAL